jgi:hypothetical protein
LNVCYIAIESREIPPNQETQMTRLYIRDPVTSEILGSILTIHPELWSEYDEDQDTEPRRETEHESTWSNLFGYEED